MTLRVMTGRRAIWLALAAALVLAACSGDSGVEEAAAPATTTPATTTAATRTTTAVTNQGEAAVLAVYRLARHSHSLWLSVR